MNFFMEGRSMYYLKLFDETLITFEMESALSLKIYNIEMVSENRAVFPEILKEDISSETIENFLRQRIVPKNRAFVQAILQAQNLNIRDIKGIIDVCKGLSLNDCYWIVNSDDVKFKDYNLYDNNFSVTLALIAFTGYSSKVKGIATSPEFTTNGALPKAWRRIDNEIFLYKGSTASWNFSNTGYEPYSEYYACQIANTMGIKAVQYDLKKWKSMLVSVCPIFTSKEYSYVSMWDIVKRNDVEKIYEWCCNNGFGEQFSDMIVFDSLILNTDRHLGNFGLLRDNKTGEYVDFAPIFDNGESLLSKSDIKIFNDKNEFNNCIKSKAINYSAFDVSFDELIKAFGGKEQVPKLRKLFTFRFTKHQMYNLPKNRLLLLESMIRTRASELISMIEKKI